MLYIRSTGIQMFMETKTHRILRLILFLSTSYSKTKEECRLFLDIKDSAFYSYCNVLKDTGFELCQKEGKYWIEYPDQDHQVLRNVLHFSEEESYLYSRFYICAAQKKRPHGVREVKKFLRLIALL
jgi:hypothetical protein